MLLSQQKLLANREYLGQVTLHTELLYEQARLKNIPDPLEFTFYDATSLAAVTLQARGLNCTAVDGECGRALLFCRSSMHVGSPSQVCAVVWFWTSQKFWQAGVAVSGHELVCQGHHTLSVAMHQCAVLA